MRKRTAFVRLAVILALATAGRAVAQTTRKSPNILIIW